MFLFYHPSGYWVYYAVGFDEIVHVELTLLTSDEASLSYCGPAYAVDNVSPWTVMRKPCSLLIPAGDYSGDLRATIRH